MKQLQICGHTNGAQLDASTHARISRLTVLDLFRVRLGLYKRSALCPASRLAVLGFPRYMQFVWEWIIGVAPMRCIRTIWRRLTNQSEIRTAGIPVRQKMLRGKHHF
jgi:hypothetical protein